jgi:hypothetical protein
MIYFLIYIMIEKSLQDSCSSVINPTSYKECSPFINNQTSSICCWVSGVYGNNNGTACISVDSLFSGKIVSYSLNGLVSVMTCGDQTTSSKFIFMNYHQFVICIILMLLSI